MSGFPESSLVAAYCSRSNAPLQPEQLTSMQVGQACAAACPAGYDVSLKQKKAANCTLPAEQTLPAVCRLRQRAAKEEICLQSGQQRRPTRSSMYLWVCSADRCATLRYMAGQREQRICKIAFPACNEWEQAKRQHLCWGESDHQRSSFEIFGTI